MYMSNKTDGNRISIPRNYAGNAFREDFSPPEVQKEEVTTFFPTEPEMPLLPPAQAKSSSHSSILSSLIPNLKGASTFPFGHGLGTEELFILGIMLLVFMSGENGGELDSELLLLLSVLLFCG